MLNIRNATYEDMDNVLNLYKDLIEKIKDDEHNPEWIYNVYPKECNIVNSIKSNELYVGEIDSNIVSSMVLNTTANKGFENIKWKLDLNYDEVYVIHLLAVHPDYSKRGFGKKMVEYSFKKAEENSIKSIRLSIVKRNLPIERFYNKFGFKYISSMEVYDEDRGHKFFKVYEKII